MRWLSTSQPPLSSWPADGKWHKAAEQPRLWGSGAGTCPSSWRVGAGSFSSHPCWHQWSSGGPWFKALDATTQTWPGTTPTPGLSSLNREYFSQAWREEWSEPEIPQVPSPWLLWRQRWALPEIDPTPGSFWMTSAFIFMPTPVWMWSVSSVQKSALKNAASGRNLVINIVLGTKLWP